MVGEAKKGGVHAGHRARIRERFRTEGLSGFTEHEVLELLLTYAIPQRDVNPLAHELIARFGSLSNALEAGESELLRVDGVGANAASLLALIPQLLGRYEMSRAGSRPVIESLGDAKRYCGALFFGAHEERAHMLCLDQRGRLLHPALLRRGTLDEVELYPREVVEIALRYHAYAVILAHNHPSGMLEPSNADIDMTRQVIAALSVIGVRVVDHVIVTPDGMYSMAQHSQLGGQADGEFSYRMRSGGAPGLRGTLRAENENGFVFLTDEGIAREDAP